jgi:hypothetical protein
MLLISWKPVALVISVYLLLGSFVILKTPYGEFPDEQGHLEYVRYVAHHRQLPVVGFRLEDFSTLEAAQPPLYYFLAALLLSANFSPVSDLYILRLFTLFLAALALIFIWKTSLLVFPRSTQVALLSTSFAAFNAQYIFTNAGVNNNALAVLLCSVTIFLCVQKLNARGRLSTLACAFGLAILTRQMAAFLFPLCVIAITMNWRSEEQRSVKDLYKRIAMFCFISFLVAGWYYIRNWIYFGDPFLYKISADLGPQFLRHEPLTLVYTVGRIAALNASFWAYFGLHRYHAGIIEYSMYLLLEVLALIGVLEILFKKDDTDISISAVFGSYKFLIASFAIGMLQFVVLSFRLEGMQGRYLYVDILPIAILLGSGLIKILPEPYRRLAVVLFPIFLCLFSVYLLITYWLPHYS